MRFSSILVNVGAGRFEARGWRPSTATNTMRVKQRIYNGAGGYRDVRTDAVTYFAGGRDGDDGHYHWHIRNLEKFKLTRLDNGRKVGTIAKHGFCFFDNYRYGSTRDRFYTVARRACGDSSSDIRVRMGLSVGWGDIYRWNLPGQYINITGLPREVQTQGRSGSIRLVQGEGQPQQLHLGRHPTYKERCEGTGPRPQRLDSEKRVFVELREPGGRLTTDEESIV